MSDEHKTRTNQHESDDSESLLRTFAALGAVFVVFMLFMLTVSLMWGYMDYMEAQGTEQACQDKYGESAEYVGDTSAFGGSGICDTADGQKYIDSETAPMSLGSFGDYLSQVEWI